MGLFGFLRSPDIHQGIKEYQSSAEAILLDVRTPQEYREGHIPGSQNIPLQEIDKAETIIENKDIPLYVYCYSGARSRQAVQALKAMGYENATNIGGIAAYQGKVER